MKMRVEDVKVTGPRFRKDLGDVEALAESIRTLGLLQPIVVTPDGTLLAGMRRLVAVRDYLEWNEIEVRAWGGDGEVDRSSGGVH